MLPLSREQKSIIAGSVILGGTRYGSEVDHVNEVNLRRLREMIGFAMWGNRGPKDLIATLLGCREGAVEPYVSRVKQITTNRKTRCTHKWIQANGVN